MHSRKIIVTIAALMMAACGSDGGTSTPDAKPVVHPDAHVVDETPDAMVAIDAPGQTIDAPHQTIDAPGQTIDAPGQTIDAPGQTIDAPAGACTAQATYTTDPVAGEQQAVGDNADMIQEYQGALNTDVAPDLLQIELYGGLSGTVFPAAIKTGTFQLTGAEANYATCAACVRILTDAADDGMGGQTYVDDYFVTGGTLTLSSIGNASDTGTLAGKLTNVTMVHVTIADDGSYTSTPVGDGCSVSIPSLNFTATVMPIPMPDAGSPRAIVVGNIGLSRAALRHIKP